MGTQEHVARIVRDLLRRLSGICVDPKRDPDRGSVRFYGLYQGIFRTVGKALATDFVPEHLRASEVGWCNTTVGLLRLVASIAAGLLWDRVGHIAVFLCGATFAVVVSVALVAMIPGHGLPGHKRVRACLPTLLPFCR